MPEFENVKPWPDEGPDPHHNEPPLPDRIVVEFDTAARLNGLDARAQDITLSAERAGAIETPEAAGKAGDLISQARALREKVGTERDELNGPLVQAQRALKARADALLTPMETALEPLQAKLDAFMGSHGESVRGDYGALVSARTQWRAEVVDFTKLPLAIRRHPEVVAAAEKVVRALVRGGERKIPGTRIWPDTTAAVR